MTTLRFGVSMLALVSVALAGDPALKREGSYWVEVRSGSEALPPGAHVRINARGAVTVNGRPGPDIVYALKIKVKARDEVEARRMMQVFTVRLLKQGGNSVNLIVNRGEGMADLDVKCPRTVADSNILTAGGAVTFNDLDGPVRVETGGGAITADRIRGNINVRTAGGDINLGAIDGSADCSTAGGNITANMIRGEAAFQTGGGDILARQVDGLVRASTMGGGIHVLRAGAGVIASTGGGPIEVGEAHGVVTARNSGGPVKVGSADGVRCENAAGAVNLDNVSGGIRVITAAGSIIASLLASKPMADSFLSTGSGDITVFIPSNLGVTIRAQNDLAGSIRRIVSEFPGITVREVGGQVVAEGRLNGGGPILRISGTGGTIFIKRQR